MQGYRNHILYTYICNFSEECCSWYYVLSIEYWGTGGHSSIYQVWILEPHPCSQHTSIAIHVQIINDSLFKTETEQTFHQKQWPSWCLYVVSSVTEWGRHNRPRPVLQRGGWCWEEIMNLDQRAGICHSISVLNHEEEIYIHHHNIWGWFGLITAYNNWFTTFQLKTLTKRLGFTLIL